jgi:hypothetical protein
MQICIGSTRWLSEWDIHARQWGGKGVLKGKVLCEAFALSVLALALFIISLIFLFRSVPAEVAIMDTSTF